MSPVPRPRPDAAKLLLGKQPSGELFAAVAEAAFAGAAPLTHNAYKLPIGKAIVREALHEATR